MTDGRLATDDEKEEAIEELAFMYPTWFFEVLTEFSGEPFVLEDFQIEYLLDRNPFKVTNKCRQSGGSLQVSLAKFFKAYRNIGYRCDIVSINLQEAADKIKYIRDVWETLPERYRPKLEIDNALSIGFHKGNKRSVVHSRAASAGVRGGKKEVVFDEFAHIMNADNLFHSAAPAIMNGDLGIDIISTPLGDTNIFADIFNNVENEYGERPYKDFSRHEFIWCDVRRFVNDFDKLQKTRKKRNVDLKDPAQMRQLISQFGTDKLKFFYNMYPWDIFRQEFCGEFLGELGSYFPWPLIQKCLKGSVGSASDGHSTYTEDCLVPWLKRPKGNVNPVYVGIDFGESSKETDKTSIQILEKDIESDQINPRFLHRYSEVLSKDQYPDFPSQAEHIVRIARAFNASKVTCDETGLGRGIVPLIRKMLPEISIEGITFTLESKEIMVTNVKTLMEQDRLWLQAGDRALQMQIRGIQREKTAMGNSYRYHGEPHDDMFWALALAAKGGSYTPFAMYQVGGGIVGV